MQVEERLEDLGLELDAPPAEKGKIAPAVRSGNLVFTSSHPCETTGKIGVNISPAEGYQLAQEAAVHCLSAIKALIGDLDKISRVVRVQVTLNCHEGYTEHVQVVHGATELLLDIFGEEAGWHVRSAAGAYQLHDNVAVEVEMIVEVRE